MLFASSATLRPAWRTRLAAQATLRPPQSKLRLPGIHRRLREATVRFPIANRRVGHTKVRLGEPEFHLPKMKLFHSQANIALRETERGVEATKVKKIDRGFVQNAISSPNPCDAMKLPNENPTPVTAAEIAKALELIERATATFAYVERLTPKQRKQSLKIRRGAHQVIPQITSVARAYGVELPGATSDDLDAAMAHARELEPVLAAAAVLHATLRDEYFSAQAHTWRRAMALYGMLSNAAKANLDVGVALTRVTAWFRAGRAKRPAAPEPAKPDDA